ncbi:MAG: hypothetical protein KBC41_01470 [Candidatus Pacebacteria bacterium]|nr:hypothetical protein [Candidatus Paceibacterota bacterium]
MQVFRSLFFVIFSVILTINPALVFAENSLYIDYSLIEKQTEKNYSYSFHDKPYQQVEYSISSGFALTALQKRNFSEKDTAINLSNSGKPMFMQPDELISYYLESQEKYKLLTFALIPYIHFKNEYGSLKILHLGEKTMLLYKVTFKDLY